MQAALYAGRTRRRTIVIDAGSPRNRFAAEGHSFLSRDGTPPLELLRIARSQLEAYPTVEVRAGRVVRAAPLAPTEATPTLFELATEDGASFTARKVVLAMGVADELPPIPGVDELWGSSVLPCPICHGIEFADKPLAFIGKAAIATEMATVLLGLTKEVTLICQEAPEPRRSALEAHGVRFVEQEVTAFARTESGGVRVSLSDGSHQDFAAVYLHPAQREGSGLVEQLGCKRRDDSTHLLEVDARFMTTVPGVFAAGDLIALMMPPQQLISAAYTGGLAGLVACRMVLGENAK